MVISKLSDDIINSFSVASSINSPSAVLKELVENSIDANSTCIKIYLKNSGFDLIRVIDNGIGIFKEDLSKICLRFNTSKIFNLHDLLNINTYGFRGESLFLIRLICKLYIASKPYSQNNAYVLNCSNYDISAAKSFNGTVIDAINLFYNNIIFKTYLSNINVEHKKIFDMFVSLALSKFNLHFLLFDNDIEIFNLPSCVDNYSKLKRLEILNKGIVFDDLIDINFNDKDFSFYGFIFLNRLKRGYKNFKYFYVNDRIVNHSIIDTIFFDIIKLSNKNIFSYSYSLYFYLSPFLYSVIFSQNKIDLVFKDYVFVYKLLYNLIYDSIFSKKRNYVNDNIFSNNYNKENKLSSDKCDNNFIRMNSNSRSICKFNDSILTVLNNSDVFFRLNDKVFLIKIKILRSKCFFNLFLTQFLKRGLILKKKIITFDLLNIKDFILFLNYSNLLLMYGFVFEVFNDDYLILRAIPVLLYNVSVNWKNLFFDLKSYLEKSFLLNAYNNRVDSNIINIFINNIYEKSECNSYELRFFYNELVKSSVNDLKWFNKNCYEICIK